MRGSSAFGSDHEPGIHGQKTEKKAAEEIPLNILFCF